MKLSKIAASFFVWQKASLKRRTLMVMAVLMLVFAIAFVTIYTSMLHKLTDAGEKSAGELTLQSAFANIDALIDSYSDMSRLIMLNSEVTDFLNARSASNQLTTRARTGIYSITNIYSNIDSVYVYRFDGGVVSAGQGITNVDVDMLMGDEWLAPLRQAKGARIVMVNGNGAISKDKGQSLLTVARLVYDVNSQLVNGLLIVNITQDALRQPLQNAAGKGGYICAFDPQGKPVFGDETLSQYYSGDFCGGEMARKTIHINGGLYTLSGRSERGLPLTILYMRPAAGATLPRESAVLVAALVIALLLAVLIIGVFVTMNVTMPIQKLTEAIDETKCSGYLERIDLPLPANELCRLRDSYNSMIDHLNELFSRLLENEKNVRRAEMRILHEQIKPHFLYNSLETISYMALQADAPRVHDALETLGSFYRNFLSKGDREIPLRREIKITQDYLALQRLRYGAIFEDEYELDESLMDRPIPKLILQPMVENSIYHGIRLKGEKGIIRVSVARCEEKILITVRDTGIGMSKEQIADALSGTQPEPDALSGFGLKGTIERIRYYCNSPDAVRICSEPGEYTQIEITVPVRERGAENV